METTWTWAERREELQSFERAARDGGPEGGLSEDVCRAVNEIRALLRGDHQFQGARDA